MSDIQLKGALTIGGINVGDQCSSFVIKTERNSVTVPGTLTNIREVQKAGAKKLSLVINFWSTMAAADFWAELWDAIDSNSGELAFTGKMNDAALSADNPEYSGNIVVLALDTGGEVGTLRAQSQTYPITRAGIALDTTP
jgi:hypothetical protein